MFTNIRVKINNFVKSHKKEVVIACLVLWLIIFIINQILKNRPKPDPIPYTTYTPHKSVVNVDNGVEETPKEYEEKIENLVDKYFNYCNNGEYENAYNLITKECRDKLYPTLKQFTGYVDYVFQGKKKIYNIQNYSIYENKYIYTIRILDDILANGTTDGYSYYEEKLVLIEENGEFKLSIGEYIGDENPNIQVEDDNMIIEITNKSVDYETETYTIKVTNKTDKYIVIADNTQDNEILLDVDGQGRHPINTTFVWFFARPNSSAKLDVKFNKYYDNGLKSNKIMLNAIRILDNYDYTQGTTQENLDNAVKLYGLDINL